MHYCRFSKCREGNLLHEFVLALNYDISLGGITSTIHAYPTFSEISRKLGDQRNRARMTSREKSICSWLYLRRRMAA